MRSQPKAFREKMACPSAVPNRPPTMTAEMAPAPKMTWAAKYCAREIGCASTSSMTPFSISPAIARAGNVIAIAVSSAWATG